MVFVKVCGLTNYDDAKAAIEAGADAVGFVFFAGSPRAVNAEKDAAWISKLPRDASLKQTWPRLSDPDITRPGSVMKVGVFVNAAADEIARAVELCALGVVQLHGDEEPEFALEIKRRLRVRVIRALRPRPGEEVLPLEAEGADYILVDRYKPGAYGGTGETGDWNTARGLVSLAVPLILSGGLSPENVREACRRVRPFGVDASSSLEREPGRKDRARISEFIRNAKAKD